MDYFSDDYKYSELTWRTQEEARDRSIRRREAFELRSDWYQCDGSGYIEEYIDVDQTKAIKCKGCTNCVEDEGEVVTELEEMPPLWAGMGELLEQETELERARRRAPGRESFREFIQRKTA